MSTLSLLIKAGVDISRLSRQTRKGLVHVQSSFLQYDQQLVITSTYDGTHSAGSLHYANQAFDTRFPEVSKNEVWAECVRRLGPDWDTVWEKDHWHFEYDPN